MPNNAAEETPRRDERRGCIIDAAGDLFSAEGFDRTTMAAVASAVGIGAPALYYYFSSKEALLFAYLERVMVELNATLDEAIRQAEAKCGDSAALLAALVAAQVDFELTNVRMMPFVNGWLYGALRNKAQFLPQQHERLRALQRRTVSFYRSVLHEGVARCEFRIANPEVTAFAILGMAQYVSSWHRPTRAGPGTAVIVRLHVDLALQMVGAEARPNKSRGAQRLVIQASRRDTKK